MKQVESKSNCLLYLDPKVDFDEIDPRTIYSPGDRCLNCSIHTGEAGVHGNGVVRLPYGAVLLVDRTVGVTLEGESLGVQVCRYGCVIPEGVKVIIEPKHT